MDVDLQPRLVSACEALVVPDLERVAKTNKSDLSWISGPRDPAVKPHRFRKHDAAVPVDAGNLGFAVGRDREFVALGRIVRQASEKPVDFLRKSLATRIEGWSSERGLAVFAAVSRAMTVAFEDRAQGSEGRDAVLGVDPVRAS